MSALTGRQASVSSGTRETLTRASRFAHTRTYAGVAPGTYSGRARERQRQSAAWCTHLQMKHTYGCARRPEQGSACTRVGMGPRGCRQQPEGGEDKGNLPAEGRVGEGPVEALGFADAVVGAPGAQVLRRGS